MTVLQLQDKDSNLISLPRMLRIRGRWGITGAEVPVTPIQHSAKRCAAENMFQDQRELVEEIKGIKEVKSMLRTSIKKIGEQRAKESKLEGIQEGIEKGIQKGIQKGIRVKAIDTAKILLKKKMPVNEIAEITELTVEEIRKLEK